MDKAMSRDNIRVLEWGTGYSTIYYSKFLTKNNRKFTWWSVDNNEKWYLRILKLSKDINVGILLFLFNPNKEEYIHAPEGLLKFDIIIIDGRYRKKCLVVARKCLKEDGVIILHDANREYYGPITDGKFTKTGHWFYKQDWDNETWVSNE